MSAVGNSITEQNHDKATLLFVDDEKRVLSSMRAMFRRDYHVFIADSGREALKIIEQERIDVIISDQRMPKMTGVELLCTVKERAPSVMRILLTGYADLEAIEASINEGEVFRYLMKPCPPDDLKKAVAMAVEAVRSGGPGVEEIELESLGPLDEEDGISPSSESGELIPFPNSRRKPQSATVHQLPRKQAKVADRSRKSRPQVRKKASAKPAVDILLLSRDKELQAIIAEAISDHEVVRAVSVDQALEALTNRRVGVMITDITVDSAELETLTKTLKAEVPELVTVIASERSDAHTLISLINEGQIYRFLLKPVPRGQCRLWLTSAVKKFEALANSEEALARYRVSVGEDAPESGLLTRMKAGLNKLRSRLRN
jgi:DNA-binding NtrC family response regulator